MRIATANANRRQDIRDAIDRVRDGDMLKLEQLAQIWGVVKARFVNVKAQIEQNYGFPAPVPGPKNSHLYPAREALSKMLDFETRMDASNQAKQARAAEILGQGRRAEEQHDVTAHSPQELILLNKLASDIEAREREQGLYIPAKDVAATASEIFSILSEMLSNLENEIDPNGMFEVEVRDTINKRGRTLLMNLHRTLKGLLNADDTETKRPAGSARKPRARRARK